MDSLSSLAAFGLRVDGSVVGCMKSAATSLMCVMLLVGCRRSDEIRRYEAPKAQTSDGRDDSGSASAPDAGGDDPGFLFEKPEAWKEAQRVVSRGGITIVHQAAFEIAEADRRATITVDRMPAMGTLLLHVNRWRGQVGLKPVTTEQLDELSQSLEIDGTPAESLTLIGAEQTILAVVVQRGNETWYFKLMGDNELADREQENFEAFVTSAEFR